MSGTPTPTEAAAALPHAGERPAALDLIAERISDARGRLARINDALLDARPALDRAWVGRAAALGAAEIVVLDTVTARAVGLLDTARSAVLTCSDLLDGIRSTVRVLRERWVSSEQRVRDTRLLMVLSPDPVTVARLQDDLDTYTADTADVTRDWRDAVQRANRATLDCRRTLLATVSGDLVYVPGRGVQAEGLSAALGADRLIADDVFRDAVDDAAHWATLSDEAQAFALASAGVFPPAGTGTVAALGHAWGARTPMQQQALVHADPHLIGGFDGLPATVRDQANRLWLTRREAELTAVLPPETSSPPASPSTAPGQVHTSFGSIPTGSAGYPPYASAASAAAAAAARGAAAAAAELANLRIVQRQLTSAGPGRLLLGVDLRFRGQAVIAIGDPDTAGHVATFVPGTGADLTTLGEEVSRSETMRAAAVEAGAADTVVVTWIGYETPPGVPSAAYDSYADAGAPRLVAFQEGLRAGHTGAPSLNTVVGHSYAGLLIAGAASGGSELAVDRVMLLSSAGLELHSVADLRLAGVPADQIAARIFASTHTNDAINSTGFAHSGLPNAPDFGASVFDPGPYEDRWVAAVLGGVVLGPGSRGLARTLPVSVGAHNAQFAPGTPGSKAVGRVIAGGKP